MPSLKNAKPNGKEIRSGNRKMITIIELLYGINSLPIQNKPVIVHGSFKSFGGVQGGPKIVIQCLLEATNGIMMPSFTYDTMVFPRTGQPWNGIDYDKVNTSGRFQGDSGPIYFTLDLPVDKEIGILSETLRRHPDAKRTLHPILSFTGVNVEYALDTQTMFDPFKPIGAMAEQDAWVLLVGVDHRVNTSIHYGEKLAGRRSFIRWAATPRRIVECFGFPGDSEGFQQIAQHLDGKTSVITIGNARVEAIFLPLLLETVQGVIKQNPLALLCQRDDCGRCNAVREMVG